jgi:hypothetical protein
MRIVPIALGCLLWSGLAVAQGTDGINNSLPQNALPGTQTLPQNQVLPQNLPPNQTLPNQQLLPNQPLQGTQPLPNQPVPGGIIVPGRLIIDPVAPSTDMTTLRRGGDQTDARRDDTVMP